MDDLAAEVEELRRRLTGRYGADVDVVALAAIGTTRHAWRSDWNGYVEYAHTTFNAARRQSRITDGEMFAANVGTTRVVLGHLRSHPDVDWDALAEAVVDRDRLTGQRTLVDLLGKTRHGRWSRWARKYIRALGSIAKKDGPDYVLLAQANEGTCYADWWAGPKWVGLVDGFIDQLTDDVPGLTISELRTWRVPDTESTRF